MTAGAHGNGDRALLEDPGANTVDEGPQDRYQRHAVCLEWLSDDAGGTQRTTIWETGIRPCVEPYEPVLEACPDEVLRLPLWRSELIDAEGPAYVPWSQVSGYECPADPLPAAVAAAWREMTISPQAVETLPNQGWAIAVYGVMADLDDAPQTQTVTVLGQQVVLRATPVETDWTVTDVVTGDSWPREFEMGSLDEEVITFDRRQHRVQLGMTTSWEGHYSLDGGSTWISARGTATTTSEPESVHVYNPRARLVNCDTMGDCMNGGTSSNPFTMTDPDADGIDNYVIPDNKIADYLDQRAKDRKWRAVGRRVLVQLALGGSAHVVWIQQILGAPAVGHNPIANKRPRPGPIHRRAVVARHRHHGVGIHRIPREIVEHPHLFSQAVGIGIEVNPVVHRSPCGRVKPRIHAAVGA